MTSERGAKQALARWIGDAKGPSPRDDVSEALDRLFEAGPSVAEVRRAVASLRETLALDAGGGLYYDLLPRTPLGPVMLAVRGEALAAVAFGRDEQAFVRRLRRRFGERAERSQEHVREAAAQLEEYLEGRRHSIEVAIDLGPVTAFQRLVLDAVAQVPRGRVVTYGELAKRIGRPAAARAVGQALRRNPVPIVIPCHRVLAADGSLGGYSGLGGVDAKARLLRLEGALP